MREKGRDAGREPGRDVERRHAEAEAKARRDAAARARRLAQSVSGDDDRAQLLDYANTLDAEADSLERQPSDPAATRKVEQPQQQAQQQAATDPAPPPDGKPDNGNGSRG